MNRQLNQFVVLYKGKPIVSINNLPPILPSDILEAYAEYSGFPLEDLTWQDVNKLDWDEIQKGLAVR